MASAGKNRKLWGLVRHHPGGEQAMRDMVARIHDEDGTAQDLKGTDAYTSTKILTDEQHDRLRYLVSKGSTWPKRRRSKNGNIDWMISKKERARIQWMAGALKFSPEALDKFIHRQTKGRGLRTHQEATAVMEPMERMLLAKGWTCTETHGEKWWDPPKAEKVENE